MLRSLYSGVSGTRAHQARMDVIGNNIANVNTTAFKAGRATFQEVMAQTLKGAGAVSVGRGSMNPMQIGLGTSLSTVENVFTQGNLGNTGRDTDVAIQGKGFFIIRDEAGMRYTRDGHFSVGTGGYLIAPSGQMVQGYMFDPATGLADYTKVQDIKLDFGGAPIAGVTTRIQVGGNLDSSGVPLAVDPLTGVAPANWSTTITAYDKSGVSTDCSLNFRRTAAGSSTWDYEVTQVDPTTGLVGPVPGGPTGTVTFDSFGKAVPPAVPVTFDFTLPGGLAGTQSVTLDFGAMTQMSLPSTGKMVDQDGYPAGTLERVSVDTSGTIVGSYSNQKTISLAQLALADFDNPAGLYKSGNSSYESTAPAGLRGFGTPSSEGRGKIAAMYLEMSNVDLGEEFTDMIVTQRGLQANTKVITTSDEILQELLGMKR